MTATPDPASSSRTPVQEPAPPPAEVSAPTAGLPRNLIRLTAHAGAAGWAATVQTEPGHCALVLTAPVEAGETVLRCVWRLTARGYRWDGASLSRYGQQTAEGITWRAVGDLVTPEVPPARTQLTAPAPPMPVYRKQDIDLVVRDVAAADDFSVSGDAMRSVPLVGSAEVIHRYTRAQALADGVLVAADADLAREAGFRVPVALTRAVWEDCVAWSDGDSDRQAPQDERGRLWDVLVMAHLAIRRSGGGGDHVAVELRRVPRDCRARQAHRVQLVCAIGPGDEGEPVITIMQPGED